MKKNVFLFLLIFFAISGFAQSAGDYNKILNGDLSAFVGYWVNGKNERVYLKSDGTLFRNHEVSPFEKTEGVYIWGNHTEWGGVAVMLFPVGVEVYGVDSTGKYGATIVKSDKTKVRLFLGQDYPFDPKEIFYKESKFPVTHIVSENLRLRTDQNLNAETIIILKKDTKVLVYKWGDNVSIDGKNARWAHVFTIDGLQGWCYSGYLKEL